MGIAPQVAALTRYVPAPPTVTIPGRKLLLLAAAILGALDFLSLVLDFYKLFQDVLTYFDYSLTVKDSTYELSPSDGSSPFLVPSCRFVISFLISM